MLLCGGGEKRETGERDGRNVAAGFVACVCGVVACTCEWLYTRASFVLSFVRTSFSMLHML